jgi:hypothetical protein
VMVLPIVYIILPRAFTAVAITCANDWLHRATRTAVL